MGSIYCEPMSESLTSSDPPTLDPVASARWWRTTQGSWLHEEVGRRMQERLAWIRQSPHAWMDWAPLNGGLQTHRAVRARYPHAHVYVHETDASRRAQAIAALQGPWWQRVVGRDPLRTVQAPSGHMQMLWANMALHLSPQPQALVQLWQQALAVDGFVMFSCLGPDTLRELAQVYRAQGWAPPSHAFTDMHDWGDMLVQAGFSQPVMDMERLTLTYESTEAMRQDLRLMGRNLHRERFSGLRGRAWLAQWHAAMATLAQPRHDGRLVLTVEVIYGHAIKAPARAAVAPTSTVSLQDMRAMLKAEKK